MIKDRIVLIDISIKTVRLAGKPAFLLIVLVISLATQFNSSLRLIKPRFIPKIHPPKLFSPIQSIKLSHPRFRQKVVQLYPSPKKPWFKHYLHFNLLVICLSLSVAIGQIVYHNLLKDLPHPTVLKTRHLPQTTKIYDRHRRLLYQIYQDQNRTPVTLNQIPPVVVQATLAIEDSNFYTHPGFSLKGFLRAVNNNLRHHQKHGGSTITQQLIKNALLTPEKTYTRKLKELLLSLLVETYYTKDEILTMYFNEVNYGGTTYGIEAASQVYFGKSAQELTLPEAALLAGLPTSPTTYSPFGANPLLAKNRQQVVLQRMVEEGFITPNQYSQAIDASLNFRPPTTDILAPHFVMFVKDWLVNQLDEVTVNQGGLEVITSLDLDLQQFLQSTIDTDLHSLARLQVSNGAGLVINPQTGEILAMVGSRDYFDTKHDGQVNLTLRPRQPGSSIKTLNYALALESGFAPSTVILDSPISYHTPGSPPYSPKNYDGKFHGPVTIRQALANSYNIPAVKMLNQLGVDRFVNFARNLGITTWNNSYYGLSVTLGAAEVTMYDLAQAYSTFANQGKQVALNPIHQVYQGNKVLLTNHCLQPNHPSCQTKTLISPSTAYQITDILADNQARSSAFGSRSVLHIPGHQVAVKTGTSNDLRDNWTIGYTPNVLVATWVGNFDNTPMNAIASGITGASPLWQKTINHLLEQQTVAFNPPPNMVVAKICRHGTFITCGGCAHPQTEYFKPGTNLDDICSQPRAEKTNSSTFNSHP